MSNPPFDPLIPALAQIGEGRAWVVGGRPRDRLLGRPGLDTDLALPEDAVGAAGRIARASGGSLVVLDAERDVARVVWPGGAELDLARFTAADLEGDLRARDFTVDAMALPLDARAPALLEAGGPDLAGALIDPTDGRTDLDLGLLRMTSGAALDADPLRMLRAARLAAELRFEVEPDTATAIRARAPLASRPAGERQRAELLRLIAADRAAEDIDRLDRLGLLEPVLPELAATRGVEQSLPHDRDVYRHCLATLAAAELLEAIVFELDSRRSEEGESSEVASLEVEPSEVEATGIEAGTPTAAAPVTDLRDVSAGGSIGLEASWILALRPYIPRLRQHAGRRSAGGADHRLWWRVAALLHDVGKPDTQRFDPERGRFRFHGHDRRGAELIEVLAERLRFGRRETAWLITVIRHHLRPLHLAAAGGATPRGVHRYFRDTGDEGLDIAYLALADNASKGGVRPDFAGHLASVTGDLFEAYFDRPDERISPPLPIDGRRLMAELDLEPGPLVGHLLDEIREALAVGELPAGDAGAALALARGTLRDRS